MNTPEILSNLILLVRNCTNKNDRISIRTSKAFHDLIKFLVVERNLSGETDLIEKAVLYYAGILESHEKTIHKMSNDELEDSKPKRIRVHPSQNGLMVYTKIFGNDFQRSVLNK